ncbi:MAG: type II toxin-antitoxin system Phd/YefM family antitoxin [Sphaerospermopsis sp. SIO1G2]|nr:type II toxin-antitoxin system Phd/YefM family antitoxin [Sphaerospermopsis sp. SIO1G2]
MDIDTGVTSTEFQNRAGLYIEQSGKNPVFMTKHNRPVRVLVDIDEYNRLKEYVHGKLFTRTNYQTI